MRERPATFVGFGFGAIQAGLFLYEAFRSRAFDRLVVAEVLPEIVSAVRRAGGRYGLNVATREGIETHEVSGVEILDPRVPADREALTRAVAEAVEMATALPSVAFYGGADPADPAAVLAAGLRLKAARGGPPAVLYAAENHNRAAELLAERLAPLLADSPAAEDPGRGPRLFQPLNTVIGKMSGVVADAEEIRARGLRPIARGLGRAFLVEAFNRILISRIAWPGFCRGLRVFEEKADLLPFEEAKLYGHNATHALLGYLLHLRGGVYMDEAAAQSDLLELARAAFVEESGAALCRRYAGLDPLFTEAGFRAYADDLLARMLNPHLRDAVSRVIRDPRRKLGWHDRLIGTVRLVRRQGLAPRRYALGAAAAWRVLERETGREGLEILRPLWTAEGADAAEVAEVCDWIRSQAAALP